jgi:thiamine biosynthesis lipoprotein
MQNNFMFKTNLLVLLTSTTLLIGCSNKSGSETRAYDYYKVNGPAQGTSYHITIETDIPDAIQGKIDSLIEVIDVSMSTYRADSYISRWNANTLTLEDAQDAHLNQVLMVSKEMFEQTSGYFDPTVGPLLAYYGFGENLDKTLDEKNLPALKSVMGLDKISLTKETHPRKSVAEVNLNFNAIAQGYTVDEIAELLTNEGIFNFMVELGGEVKVSGLNKQAEKWSIGIEKPVANIEFEQDLKKRLQTIVSLSSGQSLATSGNYRNVKVDENTGEKYGHIIDPIAMRPVKSKLLSATVVTENCAKADAIATALMAMGYEKAQRFLVDNEGAYDAFLIYINEEEVLSVWNSKNLRIKAIMPQL